ncbi:Cas9 inhibitor AcrIIA9 family protein [Caproicibacter sp. BJN0012]|uniref:Cas9 inhibitor AcrIIA9 family protein n=1 Tax=Caproicibacter sp. BJN0012 TaxID=3110227 RepID=UPI002E111E1C
MDAENQWDLEAPPIDREIQPFSLDEPSEDTTAPTGGLEIFEDEETQQAEADNAPAALAKLMGRSTPDGSNDTPAEEEKEQIKQESAEEIQKRAEQESDEDNQKRAEYEAAEAKRKAEWEAKQQAKKEAEKAALQKLAGMSDDEVMMASMKHVGDDSERLTRRNMKVCITEHIQTRCLDDAAFARQTMHPHKNMIHCFYYINRKAREHIEQEMKDNDVKPENGVYGGDVPDDLCYQWAEDYFMDPDAEEDKEKDEEFVPKPYISKTSSQRKKRPEKKKPEPKKSTPTAKSAETDGEQQSLFSAQMSFLDVAQKASA